MQLKVAGGGPGVESHRDGRMVMLRYLLGASPCTTIEPDRIRRKISSHNIRNLFGAEYQLHSLRYRQMPPLGGRLTQWTRTGKNQATESTKNQEQNRQPDSFRYSYTGVHCRACFWFSCRLHVDHFCHGVIHNFLIQDVALNIWS